MADSFRAINEQVNSQLESSSPQTEERDQQTQEAQTPQEQSAQRQAEQAAYELEKLERFKFEGQEWTAQDLKKAILRQKDYTQKTQGLSEERKAFDEERKFYENLHLDLDAVRKNPSLAHEFIRVYPEKFHSYLNQILGNTQEAQGEKQVQSQPAVPVELLSQVQKHQNYIEELEVAKANADIDQNLNSALKDFKYASRKEVLADIFELHNQLPVDPKTGRKPPITSEMWRQAAESSHNSRKADFDSYQKELIKKQSEANSKARDVGSGGGIPGQAPKKYKSFSELNKDVLGQFTSQKN